MGARTRDWRLEYILVLHSRNRVAMISPTECQAGWWIRPGIFKSFSHQRSALSFSLFHHSYPTQKLFTVRRPLKWNNTRFPLVATIKPANPSHSIDFYPSPRISPLQNYRIISSRPNHNFFSQAFLSCRIAKPRFNLTLSHRNHTMTCGTTRLKIHRKFRVWCCG